MVKEGYKQTETGLVPSDWNVCTVEYIADVKTGPFGSALHANDYVIDGVPIITVEHLGDSAITQQNLPLVSKEDKKRLSAYTLKQGDVVFSRVGSVDRSGYITEKEDGWLFSGRLLRLRIKSDSINPQFLGYYFKHEPTKQRMRNVAVGLTMASLNTKIMNEFVVAFPEDSKEQMRIALALSDVDELISNLEKLIAKKKAIKQGAMQELLTGRRRLSGFNETWKSYKVGDLGVFYSGLSGKGKNDFGIGNAQYITFMNVLSNTVIDVRALENVLVNDNENQNKVQKGDLFFNTSSETPEEVGMCATLIEELERTYLNSFCFGFRLTNAKMHPLFLSYYFNSQEGRRIMSVLAQGATRYNLSKTYFSDTIITIPDIDEQIAIASLLSDMEDEIAQYDRMLTKYRHIKSGMMSELLTGRLRLV